VSRWFDGLQVSSDGEDSVISGLLADQPALHGLLAKVRDLGLCLISVRRLDTGQAGSGRRGCDPAQAGAQARQIQGGPVVPVLVPDDNGTSPLPATARSVDA
jgi:hypothetical protein